MTLTKYVLILSAILMGSFSTLRAQQPSPSPLDSLAARETRFLAHHLQLSEAQRGQVQALTRTNMQQMDSVRRLPLEQIERVNTLSGLARSYRLALQEVLTPEQYTGYEALVAEQKRKFEQQAKNVKDLPQ